MCNISNHFFKEILPCFVWPLLNCICMKKRAAFFHFTVQAAGKLWGKVHVSVLSPNVAAVHCFFTTIPYKFTFFFCGPFWEVISFVC